VFATRTKLSTWLTNWIRGNKWEPEVEFVPIGTKWLK